MTPDFTNMRYRTEPARVWKNETSEAQVVEAGDSEVTVPAGWAFVSWQNGGFSMFRNEDVDDSFEPDTAKVTLEDFINTVSDLRNEDRTLTRRLNSTEDLLRAAVDRIAALEAKG